MFLDGLGSHEPAVAGPAIRKAGRLILELCLTCAPVDHDNAAIVLIRELETRLSAGQDLVGLDVIAHLVVRVYEVAPAHSLLFVSGDRRPPAGDHVRHLQGSLDGMHADEGRAAPSTGCTLGISPQVGRAALGTD
jgi:hypothetical protein